MLTTLAPELLAHVYSTLPDAEAVLNLSLTCRGLWHFGELVGWKVFLRAQHPSLLPADAQLHVPDGAAARDVYRSLATVERCWARLAFVARFVAGHGIYHDLSSRRCFVKRPSARTHASGLRAPIDSYDEWTGAGTSKRELLACAAGNRVVLRVKTTGSDARRMWDALPEPEQQRQAGLAFDDFGHHRAWYSWKVPASRPNKDDINGLRLLRPHQKARPDLDTVALSTYSGLLHAVTVDHHTKAVMRHAFVPTPQAPVSAMDVSPAAAPLVAATLADTFVTLFGLDVHAPDRSHSGALSQAEVPMGRIWANTFVSPTRLAVGGGQSESPAFVYDVTPAGLSPQPLWSANWAGAAGWPDDNAMVSVNAIAALPATFGGGDGGSGDVFLTGCNDGLVRLHDVRSPEPWDATFADPSNTDPIYSLAVQGADRVVAGSSLNLFKIFDFRAGRTWAKTAPPPVQRGFNVFLPRVPGKLVRQPRGSPVYCLSLPSPGASSMYACVDNDVVQLDLASLFDAHPDPQYHAARRYDADGRLNAAQTWNRERNVLNLSMYKQRDHSAQEMRLLTQLTPGRQPWLPPFFGIDPRWVDVRDLQ